MLIDIVLLCGRRCFHLNIQFSLVFFVLLLLIPNLVRHSVESFVVFVLSSWKTIACCVKVRLSRVRQL